MGIGIRKEFAVQKSILKKTIKYPGAINHKIKYFFMSQMVKRNGVIPFRIDRVAGEYTEDYYNFPYVSKEDKKWAHSKGYRSCKICWYGLNRENYTNYISDFDFYATRNYVNNSFQDWFEHKLNTYYLLKPFNENIPRHFWYIADQQMFPIDVDNEQNGNVDAIVELISQNPVAVKPALGGHGVGFYKMTYEAGNFYVNNEKISEPDLRTLILGLDQYIIEEYSIPHSTFQKVAGKESFAVLRVVTVYDKQDGAQVTGAIIRIGSKKAGVVADYPGTVYCGIDIETGKTFNPILQIKKDHVYEPCPVHPDTGQSLENIEIPNWSDLVQLVKKISRYLSVTPYLVMDIIPTESGFHILEINSHGQVRIMEPFYPFCLNKYNTRVFSVLRR